MSSNLQASTIEHLETQEKCHVFSSQV